MYPSQRFYEVTNRTTQYLVFGYQILAGIVFILGLILSYSWLSNPFIGGFLEHTFILNGTQSREVGKKWELYEQGFKQGDQLVSVNGKHITNANDLKNILADSVVSDKVTVEMLTSTGETKSATVTLRSFSAADRLAFFIMPMVLCLVFLIVSLWIFGLRRTEPAGRAFTVFTTSLAIVTGALFDLYTSHLFTYVWTLAVALAGGALIDLALGF